MPWNDPPALSATPAAQINARALRRALTDPEKRLWKALRQRLPVDGSHFRRQVPLGRYVADFCCLKARLIVEVDGNQHGADAALAYDAARTAALGAQGFRILRFSNRDVMTGIDVVLDTILAALAPPTPTPGPSPQGGGGSELSR
jgi:very-short-patch-repair endonuclease